MTVHYSDDWLTVLHGDVRDELRTLPDESVHCVITSPPYWGLRDYGTASWEGGDPACDHRIGRVMGNANKGAVRDVLDGDRTRCSCGAVRLDNQIGLEPTPEQYVENMVAVFREVRRVLRSDGTLWLNLGDSYAGGGGYSPGSPSNVARQDALAHGNDRDGSFVVRGEHNYIARQRDQRVPPSLKPKDLVGIPWRVAFALQADGWYLRSDIIWSKPNPMPESVTDRPTKSHEYLFLLSKSARYYFDADAVREPGTEYTPNTIGRERNVGGRTDGYTRPVGNVATPLGGRNIRSVWTIPTAPYPGAHFATFPPKLVEPCIKAGTSEKGVCPECGAPWERVVEREPFELGRERERNAGGRADGFSRPPGGAVEWAKRIEPTTTGWRPSCDHAVDIGVYEQREPLRPVPSTVLDPFAGSGTTGMVAQSLSRRAVLIDLNVDYLGQLMERNREIPLGLEAS